MIRGTRNALAFLSRLATPASTENGKADLADAVPFYPLVGVILGGIAALPTFFVPSLAGWLYPLILAWLTRGLHWDGLADLADACGSNATGDKFWEIIKDSRIGAFGVMALVFGIIGQILAAKSCIESGAIYALILAPACGRAMIIALARFTTPHHTSTLAALIHPGAQSPITLLVLILTLIATIPFLGFSSSCIFLALAFISLAIITRIASRHGGANGDFYGTVVITTELCVLIAACL